MDEQKGSGNRRSARISALEEKARMLSLQRKTRSGPGSSNLVPSPSTVAKKKGLKRKSLQEVVVNSVATQEGENSNHEDASIQADEPANDSPVQKMPTKDSLEFILDLLQRRDTQEIFAQPVDPDEVDGYYDIITEPMDFGTMRAKLHEGMYTSLEQFERDVFLTLSNAMKFNSSTTVFYKEARAMSEMAKRLFHSLRTERKNFDLVYSRTRRCPGKKPQDEAGCSNTKLAKPSLSLKRTMSRFLTSSHLKGYRNQSNNRGPSGSRAGRDLNSSEPERRMTYMCKTDFPRKNDMIFSAINDFPKQLNHITNTGMSYRDSLMQFVKGLGPTAQMVANRKLGRLTAEAPTLQSFTPTSLGNTAYNLIPAPSKRLVKDLGPTTKMFGNEKPGRLTTEAPNCLSLTPTFSGGKVACQFPTPSEKLVKDPRAAVNSGPNTGHGRLSNEAQSFLSLSPYFHGMNSADNLVPEQSGRLLKDLGPKFPMFENKRREELSLESPKCLPLTPNFPGNHTADNQLPAQSEGLLNHLGLKALKFANTRCGNYSMEASNFLSSTPKFGGSHTANNLLCELSKRLVKDQGPPTHMYASRNFSMEAPNFLSLTPKFAGSHTANNPVPELSKRLVNDQEPPTHMYASRKHGRISSETPNCLSLTPTYPGSNNVYGLVPFPSAVQAPAPSNGMIHEQVPRSLRFDTSGSCKGKMVYSDETINLNFFDRPAIPTLNVEQGARTCIKGGLSNSASSGEKVASLGEKTLNIGRKRDECSSSKGKNSNPGENVNLLVATLMQYKNFKSPTANTASGSHVPSIVLPSQFICPSQSSSLVNIPSGKTCLPLQSTNLSNQGSSIFLTGIDSKYLNAEGPSTIPDAAVGPKYGAKPAQAMQPFEWNQLALKASEAISNLPGLQMQVNDPVAIPINEHIPSVQDAFMQRQLQVRQTKEVPSFNSFNLFEGAFSQDHQAQSSIQCFWDTPHPSFLDNQQPDLGLQF